MALSFGAAGEHTNGIKYGNIASMNNPSAYSVSFWAYANNSATAEENIFSKYADAAGSQAGWAITLLLTGTLRIRHGSGAATNAQETVSTLAAAWSHWVFSWDGSNVLIYKDGVADGNSGAAFATAAASTAKEVVLGNLDDMDDGAPVSLCHVFWWGGALTAAECLATYAGVLPRRDLLRFAMPGDSTSQLDLVGRAVPSVSNTVTVVQDGNWGYAYPIMGSEFLPASFVTNVYKVISDTLELTESIAKITTYIKVIDETLELSEVLVPITVYIKTISDTLELYDGDYGDREDPSGKIVDTAPAANGGAETEYTKKFPPFVYRPRYTYDGD